MAAWLVCLSPVEAQINAHQAGNFVHDKLFGDYGPVSLITGKPTPRYVNGQRVLPKEGLVSSQMRRAIEGMHRERRTRGDAKGRTTDFAELSSQNLVLLVPSGEWKQEPPRRGRPIILYRKDRTLGLEFAANRFGVEAGPTNETILAYSQSVLNNTRNASIAPKIYALSARGVPGLMYRASVQTDDGQRNHRAAWVAAKNGYTYEMIVYGDESMAEAIDATLIAFVRDAREKEPNHVAHGRKEPSKWQFWR